MGGARIIHGGGENAKSAPRCRGAAEDAVSRNSKTIHRSRSFPSTAMTAPSKLAARTSRRQGCRLQAATHLSDSGRTVSRGGCRRRGSLLLVDLLGTVKRVTGAGAKRATTLPPLPLPIIVLRPTARTQIQSNRCRSDDSIEPRKKPPHALKTHAINHIPHLDY